MGNSTSAAAPAPVETPKRAIYFENDFTMSNSVQRTCPYMKVVKVNESRYVRDLYHGSEEMKEFDELVPETNQYRAWIESNRQPVMYDRISGIGKNEILILMKWIESTESMEDRVAIFDWDRTITKVEGVVLPRIKSWADIDIPNFVNDVLEYLCAGRNRLEIIRDMFRNLVEKKIGIIILTNNGSCENNLFKELVYGLFPNVPSYDPRICGRAYGGKKNIALIDSGMFNDICHIGLSGGLSGGRRKSIKQKSKKQRKTRRRRH